ncbi:hypothetical protein KFZ76_13795 [Methylovulum psychrotolerans]|uniref:hypothetical protein n=1 Tax=Methylovulum psychrotolerans TaxID=1704499 RepID=UPI001BFF0373|nr:hypothetical protein [Methylovulum psychrotolerans]MBT9098778.1 hypothetical protein [Methylovulum psychrotolerans]
MQIPAELDSQHLEKLGVLEQTLKKNTSELIAFAIDEIDKARYMPMEGERVLAILQKTGYLGGMPDVTDLSENYKDYLAWDDKGWSAKVFSLCTVA